MAEQREAGTVVKENIKVFCRLRPPIPGDEDDDASAQESEAGLFTSAFVTPEVDSSRDLLGCIESYDEEGNVTYRKTPSDPNKAFKFTGFLGPDSSQEQVYSKVASGVVTGVMNGYNGTIFAYGQTGSGKTHTMRGAESSRDIGIIPRSIEQIFEAASQRELSVSTEVSVSYLQIYCEILLDLLNPSNDQLLIREKKGDVYVEGAVEVPVNSVKDCIKVLQKGDESRITAATNLNATSSRSHAALIVNVMQRHRDTNNSLLKSTLVMVDLAGSERAKDSGALGRYTQFKELKAINLSLSALGNCVSALSQGRTHIPYRDSKLTRLLQQSLGGNARTALIVNLRPGGDETGETHSSLQFAQRALKVKVEASINHQVDYEELCKVLQEQLDLKTDELNQAQLEKNKIDAQLSEANEALERARLQAIEAEALLKASEEGFKASIDAIHNASGDDPSGERAVQAIEAVNEKWREEISNMKEAHSNEIKDLRQRWEERAHAYKQAAHQANTEWSDVEYELSKEREAHLQTIKEYRQVNERLRKLEAEQNASVSDLHADLEQKDRLLEELNATLDLVRNDSQAGGEKAEELQNRLLALEHQRDSQAKDFAENYVSREQVAMMEKLFTDTIERLGTRVEQLESSKGVIPNAPARGDMANRSRQILEKMENGNPLVSASRRIQPGGRVVPRNTRGSLQPMQKEKISRGHKAW